ncbi:phage tail protein [Nostoc sp. 3335mG]|nr:phage tail protein [Nostoc sp. 3335mG]
MDPFIGEVRALGFTYPPRGWLVCDGTTYSVQQYSQLFAVIGRTYGGDGTTTFAVPNLQGVALVHQGKGEGLTDYALNQSAGAITVALTLDELGAHDHPAVAKVNQSGSANMHSVPVAGDQLSRFAFANSPGAAFNTPPLTDRDTFDSRMIEPTGAGQPHTNQQPYLSMIYCIAAKGIMPERN